MRLKRIQISTFLIGYVFTIGEIHYDCIKGLPEGAKFQYVFMSEFSQIINFVFEHESFEELGPGALIPILEVEFNKVI